MVINIHTNRRLIKAILCHELGGRADKPLRTFEAPFSYGAYALTSIGLCLYARLSALPACMSAKYRQQASIFRASPMKGVSSK